MKWHRVHAGVYKMGSDDENVISRCAAGWWWWEVWNPHLREWIAGRNFMLRTAKRAAAEALARRGIG